MQSIYSYFSRYLTTITLFTYRLGSKRVTVFFFSIRLLACHSGGMKSGEKYTSPGHDPRRTIRFCFFFFVNFCSCTSQTVEVGNNARRIIKKIPERSSENGPEPFFGPGYWPVLDLGVRSAPDFLRDSSSRRVVFQTTLSPTKKKNKKYIAPDVSASSAKTSSHPTKTRRRTSVVVP